MTINKITSRNGIDTYEMEMDAYLIRLTHNTVTDATKMEVIQFGYVVLDTIIFHRLNAAQSSAHAYINILVSGN